MSDCAKRDEMVVFLASRLSQTEQHQLAKLGELLGGRIADTFSGSGSVCWVQKHLLRGAYMSLLFQTKPFRVPVTYECFLIWGFQQHCN